MDGETQQPEQEGSPDGSGFRVRINISSYKPSKYNRAVLRDIKLEIRPGQFVAVIGGNGAGKSSLLRAIAGELPKCDGSVVIGSTPITTPVNQLIDGVGIVHQQDELDLIGHLSIAQNIAIRQLLGRGHSKSIMAMGMQWRSSVNAVLASRADGCSLDIDQLVCRLAGGEKQILSVVIAVHLEHKFNPCRLLLLDEHTSRLDHRNAAVVMRRTVNEIHRTTMTAVMVTHRYPDARQHADRIIVMKDGVVFKDIDGQERVRALTDKQLSDYVEGIET